MEQEIKQLIELDSIVNKLQEECNKKYEAQVKINNQEIESLKLFKEQEIKNAIQKLETTYTEKTDKEIEQRNKERQKALQETVEMLEKNKANILSFLMFNVTQSFSTVK